MTEAVFGLFECHIILKDMHQQDWVGIHEAHIWNVQAISTDSNSKNTTHHVAMALQWFLHSSFAVRFLVVLLSHFPSLVMAVTWIKSKV